ncbi:MAG: hypothetical protein KGI75_11745 [Rhizobiaceae bacterium]|nr:hypothetical protein [Rhizobiaceae bacterium]
MDEAMGFLKFGAISIGVLILGYTAAMLNAELRRPAPRPEARTLILMFMAFSLVAFAGAGYLEYLKQSSVRDVERNQMAGIVGELDTRLDDKERAEFSQDFNEDQQKQFTHYTDTLCEKVKELRRILTPDKTTACRVSSPL